MLKCLKHPKFGPPILKFTVSFFIIIIIKFDVLFSAVFLLPTTLGNKSGGYAVIPKLVKFPSWWGRWIKRLGECETSQRVIV